MRNIFHVFRLINVLSLDVAAGAVASALFFCKVFNAVILPVGIISLSLSVWIIYTADHLLDARKMKDTPSSFRHRFHRKHFMVLLSAMVIAMLVAFILLFYIRRPLLEGGILLSIAVVIYMVVQRSLKYVKELSGGLLYCAGVLLPAVSLSTGVVSVPQAMLVCQFSLVVLFNLLLFALFDIYKDAKDKQQSFATLFGRKRTHTMLYVLFGLNVIILTVQLYFSVTPLWQLFAIALMSAGLFLLFVFRDKLKGRELYRPFGDAVFLIPLIFVLI